MSDVSVPRRRALRTLAVTAAAAALAAAASTPALAAPTGQIRYAGAPDAISGSYLVVLKTDTVGAANSLAARSAVPNRAAGLAARYGGTVGTVWSAALTGYSAKMSPAQARRLAADPSVAYVEQDRVVTTQGTQTGATWGLDRIDQRSLPLNSTYTYPNTASNVRAYIIDTGIRITHSDFGGRATWGTNTVDTNNTDCNGHGTHVAGTVGGATYGVAKGVRLVAVKVLNCSGSGSTAGVVSGVNWVTSNAVKPAVANMSLGGGASSTLDNAVANSISSGVTYGIAAGNSSANACNYSPARVASAITVGATTSSDARASYSNYGSCLDIFAPGSSITSDWSTGDTATNTISGTSMATPHVVGAAALVLGANPSYAPAQVASYLTSNATTGKVTSPGSGSPNRLLFVVN
ncbi:S8 family peptidase [Micromonospora solifontis]|uniref:S8 family peptidase n=1 Tax=Micromonospora solifontis TaxID=2487138 RepID=A0ABX9WMD7_9ACTN|nr:S8 family peptidase [Micromonospora solifontis]NES12881.1 S8 family peptidase [Micromonospora sp. PPF5-17B]NES34801.1 S8 family peptidase [Micromonospora solifontis]NES54806.1 S8 family peptidase [Micromonospora sp. PPF5-6]RNM01699.1 S8 family peptidase [Micromonospora solifontis]